MAIASSGAVSFSDLRTEFVGGSSAISYSDLYRGGTNIKAKASDNTATNLAASVPTSGEIKIADFRSTAKGFRKTYTSGATNQNASTIFGDDFDLDYPKEIVIDSGVELGATSTSEEALEVPSGGAGTITITNNGTLSGYGGAAGQAGGDAFESATTCTFINNGVVRSGGGGGGTGGTGGQGSYTSTTGYYSGVTYWAYLEYGNYKYFIRNNGTDVRGSYFYPIQTFPNVTTSYGVYSRGSYQMVQYVYNDGQPFYRYTLNITGTSYSSGGGGGAGGVGAGYGVSAGSGASGSSGSNNSGAGGSGGAGGDFGSAGATGATGVNGNYTNGVAGGAGGAAGKYARQSGGTLTFTNNGTVQGNAP
tara:strand:- start:357 stop:1442 length:1086 start_codon:yes stop_codon:yes gene_type:complete